MTWADVWDYAGALRINPDPFTLAQLVAMYQGLEKHTYDHTTAILNAWSKKPVRNPYRKKRFEPMTASELYAIAAALEKRNAARANS